MHSLETKAPQAKGGPRGSPPGNNNSRGKKKSFAIPYEDFFVAPSFAKYHPESLTRTIIDILFCDRLEALDDKQSNHRLSVVSEVSIRTTVQNERIYGQGYISGRADWTLGYGNSKAQLETVLAIIEAKRGGYAFSGLAQMLAYLVGVQNARRESNKVNCDVFRILTDSKDFEFVVLRNSGRAYTTAPFRWALHESTIISFLDHILRNVIESSPRTTPVKISNKQIMRHNKHLRQSFEFGTSEESDDNDEDGEQLYNVVIIKGKSLLEMSTIV